MLTHLSHIGDVSRELIADSHPLVQFIMRGGVERMQRLSLRRGGGGQTATGGQHGGQVDILRSDGGGQGREAEGESRNKAERKSKEQVS